MEIKKASGKRKQTRQQRRYKITRDKIVAAARAVFAEKGLAASVDEIVERADVARGSFYYHFKSKERLISLMVDEILTELIAAMNVECSDKKSLESMLNGIIQAHISFFSNRWQDFVLYYQGRADLTLEESFDGLEKPFVKYARNIEQLLDKSIPDSILDKRLHLIAFAIAGFLSGYYSFASISSSDQDIDKEFLSLRRAFVTGLARFVREMLPESDVRW